MIYGVISAIIVGLCVSSACTTILNPVMAQTITSRPFSVATNNTSVAGAGPQQTLSVGLPLNIIFKKAENSIVQIITRIPLSTNPQSPQSQPSAAALGSGFVYDDKGHIITNAHVVDGAPTAEVTFVDGKKYTADVVGTDVYSDIAVLKIMLNGTQSSKEQQAALSNVKPLPIANSSNVEVGDQVIAIGNPFGLSDTMTTGIVSGIARVVPAAGAIGFSISNTIQTDAPINPGNSGGPLLNMQGQVIGISTAIVSGTGSFSGIGFSIPSDTITKVVPSLIQKGAYAHPFLGLNAATLTSDIAQNITGLDAATASNLRGLYVDTITKGGPADKAGLHGSTTDQYSKKHVGDIITAIDGRPLMRIDDLITYIDQHKSIGDSVTIAVNRNGHTMDLKAILEARPSLGPLLTARLPPIPPSVPSPSPPDSQSPPLPPPSR
jgi:S1-C subfamily serine protease